MSFYTRQAQVAAAVHRVKDGKFASPATGHAFGSGGSHHKNMTLAGRVVDGKPETIPPIEDGLIDSRVDASIEQS